MLALLAEKTSDEKTRRGQDLIRAQLSGAELLNEQELQNDSFSCREKAGDRPPCREKLLRARLSHEGTRTKLHVRQPRLSDLLLN